MQTKRSFEASIKWATDQNGDFQDLAIERDVTLVEEWDEADSTSRGDGGNKTAEPTLVGRSIEFDIIYDPDSEGYQAIRDAAHNRTSLALQIVDDAGEGLQADFKFFNFTRNEGLTDVMTCSVVAKPCRSETNPSWLEP